MSEFLWLLLYNINIIKYCLTYRLFFNEKPKRLYILAMSGICITVFLLIADSNEEALKGLWVYFISILGSFLCVYERRKKSIRHLLTVVFAVTCLEQFFLSIVKSLLEQYNLNASSNMIHVLANSFVLLILILISICVKYHDKAEYTEKKNSFGDNLIVAILVISIGIVVVISLIEWSFKNDSSVLVGLTVNRLSVFAYALVGMLGFFAIYVEHEKEEKEQYAEHEKQLIALQKHYYEALLERENDTRKYRHDMINHLICLENLADEGKLDSVKRYVTQLKGQADSLQKRKYSTGNDILDILTCHYLDLLKNSTKITVKGTVAISMDEMKLCAIYSNILQNAVEELIRCDGSSELSIRFEQGKEYFAIVIRNTIAADKSSKHAPNDRKNHGLGLKNVTYLLKENEGSLNTYKDDKYFYAEAMIKL